MIVWLVRKNLLTASYLDEKVKALDNDIKQNGLLFLCEMGLDPGIDHMSAMLLIDNIHAEGGAITSFKSHCGGLIAPENDDNPWHYKITWNPANVVNAGKTGASFKQNGNFKNIVYPDIFKNCDEVLVPGLGQYAFYPNRDSSAYATLYGLEEADTFIRTTLRHPDFCKGWYNIAKAGLTDVSILPDFENMRSVDWLIYSLKRFAQVNSFSGFLAQSVEPADQELIKQLFSYLGIDDEIIIPKSVSSSSATILQHLLETKLKLNKHDKDMIVMLHEIDYKLNNTKKSIKSCMIVKGDEDQNTAMAKTVGFPLAIATELIIKNKINITGLHIPIIKEVYDPVLTKLKENRIQFEEI
ncbi:saccharopine dehydrogenase C-terminal domain-containing protein [Niabella ginsengisoli]|uniref:Saccharopine dehydrogenase n=1 Tax=Niabella ginsengisoli TaxID=522298 RepID=A0ABS9SK09_9BACT|nr:saccharopine dehydrogenase C-terminal domain-containing protein [Niabella ginsengisoli]MCH5598698.1 saccharopine dehydrogenase [Niabella ginsengisoli]